MNQSKHQLTRRRFIQLSGTGMVGVLALPAILNFYDPDSMKKEVMSDVSYNWMGMPESNETLFVSCEIGSKNEIKVNNFDPLVYY